MKSCSIPYDLMIEIFSRLPKKSVARFHCLSKLWGSTFNRPDFTKLFLTRSSARSRLLFVVKQQESTVQEGKKWNFYSSPQRQNPYEKSSSSLVAVADFHREFPPGKMTIMSTSVRSFSCGYDSGLIYLHAMYFANSDFFSVICNPKTGQYANLPYLRRYRKADSFFGFDPIDKQFKVLFMAYSSGPGHHKIMTLGSEEMRWRTIKCSLRHAIVSQGVCINGVLYYLGEDEMDEKFVIVCFDVRYEKFKFIYLEGFCRLINYKGKLGVVYWEDKNVRWKDKADGNAIGLRVWVLEDSEKQEWSKYAYTLWDDNFFLDDGSYVSVAVVGVTAKGEIVLSMTHYTCKQPFYVFYFNPERNTLQSVEVKGFGANNEGFEKRRVYTFVNHVEDLNINDAKLLKQISNCEPLKTYEEQDWEAQWPSESESEEDRDENWS
ncbi:unnamed protein product [Microthlaspi erraticum]|uniref:F-box domain-containing protein n=1 Tax=Microthlaspi erraticum TaxID=1685480 RepID=A0A6D2II54_9BRAS|nr:unnamed protein product [Microthlaspi erraticum]